MVCTRPTNSAACTGDLQVLAMQDGPRLRGRTARHLPLLLTSTKDGSIPNSLSSSRGMSRSRLPWSAISLAVSVLPGSFVTLAFVCKPGTCHCCISGRSG